MKLYPPAFGFACAAATAAIWLVLGLLWLALPAGMMEMGGARGGSATGAHMGMGLPMLIYGMLVWSLLAGLAGWLVAMIYNRLAPS